MTYVVRVPLGTVGYGIHPTPCPWPTHFSYSLPSYIISPQQTGSWEGEDADEPFFWAGRGDLCCGVPFMHESEEHDWCLSFHPLWFCCYHLIKTIIFHTSYFLKNTTFWQWEIAKNSKPNLLALKPFYSTTPDLYAEYTTWIEESLLILKLCQWTR